MPSPAPSFGENFRRLFVRGLVAVLPTLVTFWLAVWAWEFLWNNVGRYLLAGLSRLLWLFSRPVAPYLPNFYLETYLHDRIGGFGTKLVGVALAIVLIYIVGLVAGGFLGRTFYRLAENVLMRVPFIRAVYPAVKQVTDFLLADRGSQFSGSRVVAVRNHESDIWSVGFYTGSSLPALDKVTGREMVTVFIPSTPTAFAGYVVVAPREDVVELPLTVEEAMRLLISGGVVGAAPIPPRTGGATGP